MFLSISSVLPQVTEEWVARYNGPESDWDDAKAIAVDSEGNIYVTGFSHMSVTGFDYATVKYNTSGVKQWVARYNGPENLEDRAESITVDSAGNVYVIGYSHMSGTGNDYATIKYNSAGVEQWVARYNGCGNDKDMAASIAVDGSGNVYVTGTSYRSGTFFDYVTIKYSRSTLVDSWMNF